MEDTKKLDIQFFDDIVDVPERETYGIYANALKEFLDSDAKSFRLNMGNPQRANVAYACLKRWGETHNAHVTFYKRTVYVYAIKTGLN